MKIKLNRFEIIGCWFVLGLYVYPIIYTIKFLDWLLERKFIKFLSEPAFEVDKKGNITRYKNENKKF